MSYAVSNKLPSNEPSHECPQNMGAIAHCVNVQVSGKNYRQSPNVQKRVCTHSRSHVELY